MKTSIATVSISGDLQEKLAAIAAAGFDGIEIFEQDFVAFDGSPRDVGRMVRDHGLEITLFQPFRDFEGLPEPLRSRAFGRMERKFDVMQELGTDLILVCSSVHPQALGGIDRAAQDFRQLGERAAKRGLRVGFEALAWGRHISDHRDAWEVIRRADHPNAGLILDSFHTLARKIDPNSIRSIPGDRIFFVQLADAPLIEMDLLYWSRHFRNMPGEGDLPVVDFMRAVAATGYDGPLSLEIFNDQFRGGSPRAISVDGHRSLVYLMDQVRRAEPEISIGALSRQVESPEGQEIAPGSILGAYSCRSDRFDLNGICSRVPEMPARIEARGVEFIEFTADHAEAETLGAILRTLGFAPVGKHISKEVRLWRQGEINIVVNCEQEGFAHAAYLMHGTSVCDIGLRVADAAATVERARALGASSFTQPHGPQELDIPAIRGVGGGVIHFIDDKTELAKVWEIEFRQPADLPELKSAGLTRIDHIAQTMNYEEMLTWTLFYISIFDVTKTPMVDVVDPGGLVRSRAIESPDGALRLTLNGAESHRTLAGRFIAESFGSSVQHVAFATDDIFATAAALKKGGFAGLQISSNYYDDLEARFGLSEDLLTKLRAANILYDADENGEFLQLYSQTYGDGIFFEIVERRKNYNGYGAPNAPYRIAAQKRGMRSTTMPRK